MKINKWSHFLALFSYSYRKLEYISENIYTLNVSKGLSLLDVMCIIRNLSEKCRGDPKNNIQTLSQKVMLGKAINQQKMKKEKIS